MPRQERVYCSIDKCLFRSYTEIMNKTKMITEPSPDQTGVSNPLMIQSLEKSRRNYILKSTKDYGAGIRQLSRLTGVSYGVIQKL